MAYTVRIKDNETGEIVARGYDKLLWHDPDGDSCGDIFWWTEGNMGCDCNRHLEFVRAKYPDGPDPLLEDEDIECGHSRYTVIDATLEDGRVVPIDEETCP